VPDPVPNPEGGTPPAPAPVPPPAAAEPAKLDLTSDQLKERLREERERARGAFLKDLGFEKSDDLKGALGKLKELETASLSQQEKTEKELAELRTKAARADGTTELLKLVVDEQFSKLPESVQKIIDETADGDPEQRLLLMRVVSAATASASADPAAPPPPPGPKTVSPKPAPAPQGAETAYDKWQSMQKKNGLLADLFFSANQREIEASRPAGAQQ